MSAVLPQRCDHTVYEVDLQLALHALVLGVHVQGWGQPQTLLLCRLSPVMQATALGFKLVLVMGFSLSCVVMALHVLRLVVDLQGWGFSLDASPLLLESCDQCNHEESPDASPVPPEPCHACINLKTGVFSG